MIDKFFKGFKKKKDLPKHVALSYINYSTTGTKVPAEQFFKNKFNKLKELLEVQTKLQLPVFTVFLVPASEKENVNFSAIVDSLADFLNELSKDKRLYDNKIKVSALGKWYNLPNKIVEAIKKLIEETRDYDGYFLNFCINYDGQEEIVDACRIIGRKVKANKLDPDAITKEMIKENLYSSYFLPPDLIVKTDGKKDLRGFLLWDSVNAKIYFSDKTWQDLSVNDIIKAIEHWQKWKELS